MVPDDFAGTRCLNDALEVLNPPRWTTAQPSPKIVVPPYTSKVASLYVSGPRQCKLSRKGQKITSHRAKDSPQTACNRHKDPQTRNET